MWNANYHAEHHRYPAVPTLNLHELHKALPEPHPLQEASYTAFHYRLIQHLNPFARKPRPFVARPNEQ
jgi:fatty acid desaturase